MAGAPHSGDSKHILIDFPALFLTRLTATGDLAHLARESLGPELAGEVVQGARLPLVQQALQEEQQRHIPRHLVLHGLHVACTGAVAFTWTLW